MEGGRGTRAGGQAGDGNWRGGGERRVARLDAATAAIATLRPLVEGMDSRLRALERTAPHEERIDPTCTPVTFKAVVEICAAVWGVGVLLYEIFYGRTPFEGEGFAQIAMHILWDAPLHLGGDSPLDQLLARRLRKDPLDRFQSMGELDAALASVDPSLTAECEAVTGDSGRRLSERMAERPGTTPTEQYERAMAF